MSLEWVHQSAAAVVNRKLTYSTSLLIILLGSDFVLPLLVSGLVDIGSAIQRLSILLSHCEHRFVRNELGTTSRFSYNCFVIC